MCVHDCARAAHAHDREVKPRLVRGATTSAYDFAAGIHLKDMFVRERPLVHAASGDRQPEGIGTHHGAEVAASTECPPTPVKTTTGLGKKAGEGGVVDRV